MKLIIYTDGGARGNPGPAGIGVVIREGENVVKEYGRYIGETTNNQAEYRALVSALESARDLGADEVDIFVDSELIAKQVKGEYKVKNSDIASVFLRLHNLRVGFKKFNITHIPREKNKDADKLVNQAIDRHQTRSL